MPVDDSSRSPRPPAATPSSPAPAVTAKPASEAVGDTAIGATLRDLVLNPAWGDVSPRAEALMYAADKAQHVHEVVMPALRRGAVVISDRYVDSMLAYQGAGRVLDPDRVEQIARWATEDLLPDLTVLLDLDPDRGLATIRDKDRLEDAGADLHLRARQFFLDLAARDPEHYLVLPARTGVRKLAAGYDRLPDRYPKERVRELVFALQIPHVTLGEVPSVIFLSWTGLAGRGVFLRAGLLIEWIEHLFSDTDRALLYPAGGPDVRVVSNANYLLGGVRLTLDAVSWGTTYYVGNALYDGIYRVEKWNERARRRWGRPG